jgi:hypothetical protein
MMYRPDEFVVVPIVVLARKILAKKTGSPVSEFLTCPEMVPEDCARIKTGDKMHTRLMRITAVRHFTYMDRIFEPSLFYSDKELNAKNAEKCRVISSVWYLSMRTT